MIICAGNNETFPFAQPVGVGLVETAINLTRIALLDPPEFLLFIGSAGSYGGYDLFSLVESSASANVELAYLDGSAYTPIDNVIQSDFLNVSRETNMPIVNSSNYITTDMHRAKQLRKLGLELENMEFFSVMQVARSFQIPVGGVFVVTNYCDEEAHSAFVRNHERAMRLLIEYVVERYGRLIDEA